MLVDEGSNMEHLWGQLYATPAVAEKGMLDAEIRVETLGGHSSVPRESSSISIKWFEWDLTSS
jgi:Gly-Xaa carboxypeptidase